MVFQPWLKLWGYPLLWQPKCYLMVSSFIEGPTLSPCYLQVIQHLDDTKTNQIISLQYDTTTFTKSEPVQEDQVLADWNHPVMSKTWALELDLISIPCKPQKDG